MEKILNPYPRSLCKRFSWDERVHSRASESAGQHGKTYIQNKKMLRLLSQEKESFKKEQTWNITNYEGWAQSICSFLLYQILPYKNKWKHKLSQYEKMPVSRAHILQKSNTGFYTVVNNVTDWSKRIRYF